ncbi:MAG: hypothetical protein K0Q49_2524 [Haloplasmataceae bacterium]|jgi:integral membrane sensor domain MASE1|nr:hypothetical protein [Haloplasmataceae bacterium]
MLEKLSSYNLLNYLLPGVVTAVIASKITSYNFLQANILEGVFYYYFIGMIVSRFGSLIIEPLLIKIKFIKFAKYSDFLSACSKDSKLEIMSEVNNTYRSLLSAFLCISILKVSDILKFKYSFYNSHEDVLAIFIIVFLLLFSYKKQVRYSTLRIEKFNQ